MARVEWTRQTGDDVEAVVGMLICSKYPNAVRVTPSQGDGGIDIFIPGPTGFAKERKVYQVKKYCERLTSSQKRKIKRSYDTMVATAEAEGWRITEWHLVMPLDLTDNELNWFKELTGGAGFPCEPNGLVFCDTRAAEFPKVIDYYLRDGKERLQAAMDNLTAVLSARLGRSKDDSLTPADVMTDLVSIHKALNACDPFYKYNFDVSDTPPPDEPPPNEEGLVAVSAMRQDSVWITFKIYALSLAAIEEHPITWRLQLAVPADDDELRKQVEKFIDYGAPLSMPAGTVSGALNLPAGLGGDVGGNASLRVSNVNVTPFDDEQLELEIAMLAADSDTVIASTTIKRTDFSRGQEGAWSMWVDKAELFQIEMLASGNPEPRTLTWNISTEYDLVGRHPADIVDSLKFLAAMRSPNRIGIGLTYGPKQFTIAGTAPNSDDGMTAEAQPLSVITEALARIQDHVQVLLRMPEEFPRRQAIDIIETAKVLAGEPRTGTMGGPFTIIRDGAQLEPETDKLYEFIAIRALTITLGGNEITVGKQALFFRGTYVEITDKEVKIEPLAESVSARYTGTEEAGRLFARPVPEVGAAGSDAQSP